MNSILKKLIFVVAFVLATLVLPAFLLLMFIDASQNFGVFVIAFGVIIFAILGYIIASIRSLQKKFDETMDEIKMQNAAIAYKLTNGVPEAPVAPQPQPVNEAAPVQSTANIPLNPADPLVMPASKKTDKKVDDGFDDFK